MISLLTINQASYADVSSFLLVNSTHYFNVATNLTKSINTRKCDHNSKDSKFTHFSSKSMKKDINPLSACVISIRHASQYEKHIFLSHFWTVTLMRPRKHLHYNHTPPSQTNC